ncbi:MAG: T9SS type A sorting domain-containing protein, partial [Ignavibacteriaceae bacterium]|nr:T9SS type A sorting domain-containing protein [Ignavibacteriaceae bacterium]
TTQITSSGSRDIFIAKYDSNGNFLWVQKAGWVNSDEGYGISTDNSGNCYVTGYFISSALFGTIILNASGPYNGGGFITKIRSTTTTIIETPTVPGTEIPLEYGLSQNYPNPFNPSTVIRFGLPKVSDVEISIYTINGEYVQTFLSETKEAGYYELTLEIKEMSSGVYLYRIKAIPHDGSDAFMQVKKLIVMK